jgi:serine/threonine protein kinase
MALASGSRLGSYEILAPLGAGGMGEVFRARGLKLSREVALKVLPTEFAFDADGSRVSNVKRSSSAFWNSPCTSAGNGDTQAA